MSVTRNQRVVVNESLLLGGQVTRSAAMNITRAAFLAAAGDSDRPVIRTVVPIGSRVKLEPCGSCAPPDQPLDFSVKSSSNSPSPQLQTPACSQTNSATRFSRPGNSISPPPAAPAKADRAVESLLMLSGHTGVQSPCSSSSPSSLALVSSEQQQQQQQQEQQRPIASVGRNRRKPANGDVQRRGFAAPHDQTDGLLVVSQGDLASPAWQSSSTSVPNNNNSSAAKNMSISSASLSSASFSPSSNNGANNRNVRLINDESVINNNNNNNNNNTTNNNGNGSSNSNSSNNRHHRQSSSSSRQMAPASIPPDSTTASMDGDGDGDGDDGDGDGEDGEDDNGQRIKVRTANGVVNRRRPRAMPDARKDESYWERRRKNNEAAKRSRDARRQKEDDVAFHCRGLEAENKRLRDEIAELRAEIQQLRAEVLARQQQNQGETGDQLVQMETERACENSDENCDPIEPRRPHEMISSEAPVVDAASASSTVDHHSSSGGNDNDETGDS